MAGDPMKTRLGDEMRAAMKARDQVKVATLRMLLTSIKNAEVEKIRELSDDETLEVVAKEAKRRRESIEAYKGAGRDDLADREAAELAVLEGYLPAALGDEELAALVDAAIAEAGATEPRQMGDVMKVLMPRIKGRADGARVSGLVKERLGA